MTEQATEKRTSHHTRHREDTWVDHAEILTVPRWKTSGLSGDEWRFSYRVVLRRKGWTIHEQDFGTLGYAARWLALHVGDGAAPADFPWPKEAPGGAYGDGFFCDNPGCDQPAAWRAWLKAEYCARGHKHVSQWTRYYRVFCQEHSRRGDCALEDADRNYDFEPILPDAAR